MNLWHGTIESEFMISIKSGRSWNSTKEKIAENFYSENAKDDCVISGNQTFSWAEQFGFYFIVQFSSLHHTPESWQNLAMIPYQRRVYFDFLDLIFFT